MPLISILEVPWESGGFGGIESPEDIFGYLFRHWPHYIKITLSYSMSWTASQTVEFDDVVEYAEGDPPEGHIECAATSRTNINSGSISGNFVWNRQTEADENSNQPLEEGEFAMGIRFEGNASTSPRMDSVLFHHVSDIGDSGEISGSSSQTLYGGDACEVTEENTSGTITATAYFTDLGIYESGNTWAKRLGNLTVDLTFGDFSSPFSIPVPTSSFVTTLAGGSPQGTAISFTSTESTTIPDTGGWHGSISANFTLTLSTS